MPEIGLLSAGSIDLWGGHMAGIGDVIRDLTVGDKENEVVKAGTFAVTRLTGWVGAVAVLLTNTELFGELTDSQRLWASIAILGVFAFIASADALARAYSTSHALPEVRPLVKPINVSVPSLPKADETGWKAILLKIDPATPDELKYWIVKGQKAQWIEEGKIEPS